jgi:hypothetical protein
VITHRTSSAAGVPRRVVQVTAATATLLLGSAALTPAFADTPAAWPTDPHVSGWDWLVHLFLIPFGVFVLVWVAISVPSFRRQHSGGTAEAWGERREWFGGPRESVDAAEQVTPEALAASEEKTGGASGRW